MAVEPHAEDTGHVVVTAVAVAPVVVMTAGEVEALAMTEAVEVVRATTVVEVVATPAGAVLAAMVMFCADLHLLR